MFNRHNLSAPYHGLQVLLARQRGSFNYTVAYTFSKVLGFNAIEGGGPTCCSTTTRPTATTTTAFSTTTARTWPRPASAGCRPSRKLGRAATKAILGGWQLAGILNYVSGSPLLGNFGLTGTGVGGVEPWLQRDYAGSLDSRANPILTCNPAENAPERALSSTRRVSVRRRPATTGVQHSVHEGRTPSGTSTCRSPRTSASAATRRCSAHVGVQRIQLPDGLRDGSQNLTLRYEQRRHDQPDFGKLGDDFKFGRRIIQFAVRFTF